MQKQHLTHIIQILAIFILVRSFVACNTRQTSSSFSQPSSYQVIDSLIVKLGKVILTHDRKQTTQCWSMLKKQEKKLIEYLQFFEDSLKTPDKYFKWINLRPKSHVAKSYRLVSKSEGALYMLCALYYDDYFFAQKRILYNQKNKQGLHINETTSKDLKEGWGLIKKWLKKYRGLKLADIPEPPFRNSELKWLDKRGKTIFPE